MTQYGVLTFGRTPPLVTLYGPFTSEAEAKRWQARDERLPDPPESYLIGPLNAPYGYPPDAAPMGPKRADETDDPALRPARLATFEGQQEAVLQLGLAIKAALLRQEPMEHALFYGPPGTGKTSLAAVCATEMGGRLIPMLAPAIDSVDTLLDTLLQLRERDVLFLDEIHRLPVALGEYLYSAMEDYRLDLPDGRGGAERISLPHFTLIGATTKRGALAAPLRDRFGLHLTLTLYAPYTLSRIVSAASQRLDLTLGSDAADCIARRSRGTPRVALRLLRRVRDYAAVDGTNAVTMMHVTAALSVEGIDERGLDALDRRYLRTLAAQSTTRPVGIRTIAATMQEDVSTLEESVEPFLLSEGLLLRTGTGRTLGPNATSYLRSAVA